MRSLRSAILLVVIAILTTFSRGRSGLRDMASFSDWMLDPWASWVRATAGRRLLISVPMLNQASSGKLADGANGAFDGYFATLAQEIADTGLGEAIIRLGWEANGDWFAWKASADPGLWKQYFRRKITPAPV